jgi:hypothetical protein
VRWALLLRMLAVRFVRLFWNPEPSLDINSTPGFCCVGEMRMSWTPGVVPYGADETVYLVVDSFGARGSVYRETEIERADLETVISDLITGQFSNPVRVVAFNTLEHWAKDVSADIADEIQTRCDIEGVAVPEHIRDFVVSHTERTRQLNLRLA